MSRYVAIVDGKPGAFGVVVPDLPGCTSAGDTIEAALTNAVEAVRLWVEDAEADGESIPEPRPVEALRNDPSVAEDIVGGTVLAFVPLLRESGRATRVNLSLDAGMLDAIDAEAKRRGLTRSAFLASAARDAIVRGI
jgi:predicted RNase H-like HicB family nuclease